MQPLLTFSLSDIDLNLATRAHYGTSFSPERRGADVAKTTLTRCKPWLMSLAPG